MFLINLWVVLVGVVVILYVILDGFSLGVGILFPFAKDEKQRDMMMDSIAPVWDANQTWIVFGGAALFAVFPMIYTVLFSALYIPLFTFLFGLIFRGVAFEFRANSTRVTVWNRAFSIGSLVAAFAQGLTLGAYISGIKVQNGVFAGGAFDWLEPFNIMVGLGLIAGYSLLGAAYLIIKTTGEVQQRAYRQAWMSAWAVAAFMFIVSIWTPLQAPDIMTRWWTPPRIYFVWLFPVLGTLGFIMLLRSINQRQEYQPFMYSLVMFFSAYLGLQSGVYPYAVMPDITVFQAAAQPLTQTITLIGALVILPVVLGYTIYSYWVFRGKVGADAGYH
ncbi:MAG: cytochrome d ubiquinol oxidase subunit II [Desulfobacteraceae bacterium]|nr:MAG: cytochrome d ubiquinol oxidase subunit II [Desulfobacteraceae bacterium]